MKFGPKYRARFLRVILWVSVDQSAIIKSKSTGKQETYHHKSIFSCELISFMKIHWGHTLLRNIKEGTSEKKNCCSELSVSFWYD